MYDSGQKMDVVMMDDTHNSALYLPCTRKNPPAKTPLLSGKPTWAHLVRTIVYYEWARHKNPAAYWECFEWAQKLPQRGVNDSQEWARRPATRHRR